MQETRPHPNPSAEDKHTHLDEVELHKQESTASEGHPNTQLATPMRATRTMTRVQGEDPLNHSPRRTQPHGTAPGTPLRNFNATHNTALHFWMDERDITLHHS